MQQTSNYNLNKPEQTDAVNIDDINANFDTLDAELKKVSDKTNIIQTASGTGTAITLTNVNLVNGFTITFIVAANNNGATTTINGKYLYKPSGTTAPTLTAGKAVTVWYNGTNFFIKASAGGGNATPSQVLAPNIFSADDYDEAPGTMPNRGAVSITPSEVDQVIPEGYHNGSGKVLAVPILVEGLYNFPLYIQDVQPTGAVSNGAIWVKSSTLGEQITKAKILEAVNTGEADGTLMFVVGDLALHSMSFAHDKDIVGGNTVDFSIADTIDPTADWVVSSLTGEVVSTYKLHRPIVYSKLDGILDIETSYMWDGNSWRLICEKNKYIITADTSSGIANYYSYTDNTIALQGSIASFNRVDGITSDGKYILSYRGIVYVRNGAVISEYFTIPNTYPYDLGSGTPVNYVRSDGVLSKDGNTLVVSYYYYNNNSWYDYIVVYFKNNGSTFVAERAIHIYNSQSTSVQNICCNEDASLVTVFICVQSGNYFGFCIYKNLDYKMVNITNATGLFNNPPKVAIKGGYILINYTNSNNPSMPTWACFIADFVNGSALKIASGAPNPVQNSNFSNGLSCNGSYFSFYVGATIYIYDSNTETKYSGVCPDTTTIYGMSTLNVNNDRLVVVALGTTGRFIREYAVSLDNLTKAITLTLLTSISTSISNVSNGVVAIVPA